MRGGGLTGYNMQNPNIIGGTQLIAKPSAVNEMGELKSRPIEGVKFRPTRPVPHGKFRWTGPQRQSTIDLPIRLDREFIIRVHVLGALCDEFLPPQLKVGLSPASVEMERTAEGTFLLLARAQPHEKSDSSVSVTIELKATIRPCDLGINSDQRWLGAMVNWIELQPVM